MARKPYKKALAIDWFLKHPHLKSYMIREFTCVGMAVYILNLMALLAAFACDTAQAQGYIESWMAVQRNPAMIVVNIWAFASALCHTISWFAVTPKVFKIQKGEKFVDGKYIVWANWAVYAFAALIILCLAAR